MKVRLKRAWSDSRATLGMLTIGNGMHDPFFTLENPLRTTKVDSRIPKGTYICKPYSGTKYKDVYEITNVPGRSAILFHWGNKESHTEGCILIGNGATTYGGEPFINDSKAAFQRFRKLIGKNEFTLTIED